MAACRLLIRGVVQGVGFRYATRREAVRLGIDGWVRNRADGSVEVLAVGDPTQLEALQRWAGRGPPSAHVEAVEATELTHDEAARLGPPLHGGFRQVDTAWD